MTEPTDSAPVDYLLVELPSGTTDLDRESARELASLEEVGMIRLLEVAVIHREPGGEVQSRREDGLEQSPRLHRLADHPVRVLSDDDLDTLGDAVEAGRPTGVLVWENTWATPLIEATRLAGGRIVDSGRITTENIARALAERGLPPPTAPKGHPA